MIPYEDYNLVRDVQADSREAKMALYRKFERLIRKKACLTSTPDDFMQDAYELMIKAANKVRIVEIKDPERWGFHIFLSWFLNVKVKKQLLRDRRHYEGLWHNSFDALENYMMSLDVKHPGSLFEESTSISQSMNDGEKSKSRSALRTYLPPSNLYTRYDQNAMLFLEKAPHLYKKVMASCSEEEKDFVEAKQDGRSIQDVVRERRTPYAKARKIVQGVRERAKTIVVEERLPDRNYVYGTVKRGSLLEESMRCPKIDAKIAHLRAGRA